MEDTSGFYKQIGDEWLFAPNFVSAPNYELMREHKDEYKYPVDGWKWFDEQPYENLKQEI